MKNQPLQENKKPIHRVAPLASEGRDGSQRFVADNGNVYLYYKYQNEWYRTKMEKV